MTFKPHLRKLMSINKFNIRVKRILNTFFLLILLSGCETALDENPQTGPEEVEVEILPHNESYTMRVKDTVQITYRISPDTVQLADLEWSSANPDVVSVTKEGLMIAHTLGQTQIKGSSIKGKAETMVDVIVIPTALQNIHLEAYVIAAYINQPKTLEITYEPADATDKTLLWETSDYSIVSIDQAGTITAKKHGYAWIAASQGDEVYDAAIIIPASENQLLAASHVNSTTHDQRHYIEIFVAGLEVPVTINEIKLYLGSKGSPNATELRTITPSLTLQAGEGQELSIELNSDEAYEVTFGRYLRLDVSAGGKDYYVYLSWFNNFTIEEK